MPRPYMLQETVSIDGENHSCLPKDGAVVYLCQRIIGFNAVLWVVVGDDMSYHVHVAFGGIMVQCIDVPDVNTQAYSFGGFDCNFELARVRRKTA